uniref:Protein kinase domain-containing protein n=1 Tax=Arcella intermedia TaxID=1963864 RepID=A0A6B2L244_9EUKA
MYFDEGLRRSATFWVRVVPMYAHYKVVEWQTKGRPDQEIEEAFGVLHRRYSPEVERLTLKLRGFYLKQAQMMGTIDYFVPKEYLEWCKKMQDEVPSTFLPGEARRMVEEAIGKPIEEVFSYWNDMPRGVASIGEVHHAILKDGREVAIKIQFPNIERKFRSDLNTIRAFCKLAMPHHVPPLNEIEKQFLTEFDYIGEAKNLEEIHNNIMPTWKHLVAIPRPVMELCSKNVLVMEYIHGVRLIDGIRDSYRKVAEQRGTTLEVLEEQQKQKIRRGELNSVSHEKWKIRFARVGLRCQDLLKNYFRLLYNLSFGLFTQKKPYQWSELPVNLAEIIELLHNVHAHQIFYDGCFNGDPHPGNILLMHDGRLGLIDYGQVKKIPLESRINYAKLICAMAKDDKEKIVDIFVNQMGMRGKHNYPETAYRIACFWNDRTTEDIMQGLNIPSFLDWIQAQDPIDKINDDYVMVARVSVLLRGMGNAFGLHLRTSTYWKEYAEKLLKQHHIQI